MKVLITGVAGFLGSHLADSFLELGHEVLGIDNLLGGYKRNVPEGVEFHEIDIADTEKLHEPLTNVELVIHSACTAYEGLSVFSPSLVVQNTSQITASLLSASVRAGVSKFVYMSSMARYGTQEVIPFTESLTPKPQDPYGIAKYASELLTKNICDTHGLKYTILVPHNIIGPRQKYDDPYRNVASIMINRMLSGKQPIIYGDGSQMRCFSFIQDVINPLMVACLSEISEGKVINIGPDEEFITINELAARIAQILGFKLEPIYMPGRPQEVAQANCSSSLARELLGYKTSVSLDEGLIELAEWIKKMGPKEFEYKLSLEFVTDATPRTWVDHLI